MHTTVHTTEDRAATEQHYLGRHSLHRSPAGRAMKVPIPRQMAQQGTRTGVLPPLASPWHGLPRPFHEVTVPGPCECTAAPGGSVLVILGVAFSVTVSHSVFSLLILSIFLFSFSTDTQGFFFVEVF